MKTVDVHPEQRHKGDQMSHMQRGCRRVDPNVSSYPPFIHEFGETPLMASASVSVIAH